MNLYLFVIARSEATWRSIERLRARSSSRDDRQDAKNLGVAENAINVPRHQCSHLFNRHYSEILFACIPVIRGRLNGSALRHREFDRSFVGRRNGRTCRRGSGRRFYE